MGICGGGRNQNKNAESDGIKIKPGIVEKENSKSIEAKIVLLGDQNVGKSSIAQRFCKNIFTGQYVVTIGGAYLQQKIVLNNGVSLKLHIWDTGGQERFRSMANLYYRDAAAAILTYDIGVEKSFEGVNYWVEELKSKSDQDKIVLALAGNKCDRDSKERAISTNEAKGNNSLFFNIYIFKILAYAEKNRMVFQET